jgi:hypothetical protein
MLNNSNYLEKNFWTEHKYAGYIYLGITDDTRILEGIIAPNNTTE